MHLDYPATAERTIYAPPIIFDRNAHLVPTLVRVADLFWCGAGLSCHYVTSTVRPPTSVYSLSLSLVDHVGGWDAGDEAIGEDMHMYLKCFFALKGNLHSKTLLSPASQTNVHSDGKGVNGFMGDCKARYRQALRHMWGSLDSGYAVHGILQMSVDRWRNNLEERSVLTSSRPYSVSWVFRAPFANLCPTGQTGPTLLFSSTAYLKPTSFPSTSYCSFLRQASTPPSTQHF